MGGLAYLEWRYALHRAAAIARSPARLALWIGYAAFCGFLIYLRLQPSHRDAPNSWLVGSRADIVVSGYAVLSGFEIVRVIAFGQRIFAFRNAAEAVLFSNAGIRPLYVALWLQLRKLAASGGRWLASVAYWILIFFQHNAASVSLRLLLVSLLALAVFMSLDLPVFLLGRTRWRGTVLTLGCALLATGTAFGVLAFAAPSRLAPVVRVLRFDPGVAFTSTLQGNGVGVLGLVALLAALACIVALLGDDALPELYATSQQKLATRLRTRRASREGRSRLVASPVEAHRIPAGAWTLVWKNWVAFRRGRLEVQYWLAECSLAMVVGTGIGIASRLTEGLSIVYSIGATAALVLLSILMLSPFAASLALASDLQKPLFWLSSAPLQTRIAAWTFARSWRGGLALACVPLAAGAAGGNLTLALAAVPATLATYSSLQALGVGLFALFPNPIDARGPMTFVRLFLTFVYCVPPVTLAILVGAFHAPPSVTALVCASAFALEGWVVLEIASLRFVERGALFANVTRSA
jgi:hypothetical protein